jgi:peptide/nickel transport system permease protein
LSDLGNPPVDLRGPLPAPLPAPGAGARRSDRADTFRRLLASKTFVAGVAILGFWILAALVGTHFTQSAYDSSENTLQGISSAHWFGTDKLGRDIFARVIAGSREILVVAPLATLLGVAGGTLAGLVSGYFHGSVDNIVSRIMDALLALPLVITAVVAITALGISNTTLVATIGVVFAPLVGRTVRTAVLVERDLDYVQAAKLRGEHAPYIMFVEILPNVAAPILVEFTVRLGYAIFTVASLSFLGFGPQPPSPDWGAQVADNYQLISFAWWTVLFPALAIASLVIAVNLISDGVTQVVDT